MNDEELIQKLYVEAQSLRLLYVEDDVTLCENTRIMLEDFFEIVVKNDGEEGLNAYNEQHFDIILTDIVMPNMDGKEMSKIIREQNPDQVIIVMSAYEESRYFMELIDIGISSFVPKPPSLHQLFSTLLAACVKINNAKKVEELSKEMAQDLKESKQLLRTIIDTVPVRIFWKDKESRYLGCNKLFLDDFDLKDQSELIGKSDFEMSWKKYAQDYFDDDQLVMETRKNKINYEEKLVTADGNEVWLSTSKVVLYDEHGEPMGVLGTYSDITEYKQ
jgi:PAS domain S-box-containing protein